MIARMRWIEYLLIAAGLAMDAFAVSVCTGMPMKKATVRKAVIVGLYFGAFQAAMPLIGYLAGSRFAESISAYDHWIAFVLLAFIGGKMLLEGLKKPEKCGEESAEPSLGLRRMLPFAVATSIDALAVGVSFAFLNVEIVPAVVCIGAVTLILSAAGVKIGHVFGLRFKSKAELIGGAILILMGLKILIEHLRA